MASGEFFGTKNVAAKKNIYLIGHSIKIRWLYPLQKHKTLTQKRDVQNMILNCIWWWGSSSGDLGNVEYTFIANATRSTMSSKVIPKPLGIK